MLLLTVAEKVRSSGRPVAFVDIEKFRDNPYPDVLIRLLIDLTKCLEDELGGRRHRRRKRRTKKSLQELRSKLEVLLHHPQQFSHRVSDARQVSRKRRRSVGVSATTGELAGPFSIAADMGGERTAASGAIQEREAAFVRTKLEGLRAEATEFGDVLREAVAALGGGGAVVILDDFYFIPRNDQPDVLSYLQQVVKNHNIWLKIGAVEHRLNEFVDGDPPRGLQLTQDAGKVSMDITLADFDHTRAFLEAILDDICSSIDVVSDDLLTANARLRLVSASGGVPRDYLNLVTAALAKATKRDGHDSSRPRNRITSEDVNEVAPEFRKQKEDDLRVDALPEDADRLRRRLNEVLNFCVVDRRTNVFTVDARLLREEQWGRDIAALADLRFFHRFGQLTVQSSDRTFVGLRYEGFVLDLSSYATARVRTNEVEFWTPAGLQKARGVVYVYRPDIAEALRADRPIARTKKRVEPVRIDGQIDLFAEIDALAVETIVTHKGAAADIEIDDP